MDIKDYISALRYGATINADDIALTEGYELRGASTGLAGAVLPTTSFISSTSVGTAAISAGTVTLLADSLVTAGRKVYLTGWQVQNNATAFVTGSGSIFAVKSSGGGTTFFSFGTSVATLENALTSSGSPSTYSLDTPCTLGGGGIASKGLIISNQGTLTSGDLFTITCWGYIK